MRPIKALRTRAALAMLLPLALFVTEASVAPAATAAGSYTITTSAGGSWSNPDDSPASPFIDKDGKFYFQQAHALYGPNDSRKWSFFTGSNFDSYSTAGITNTADNANTTTRCNNSPTGLKSTYAPNRTGYSQRNYCDLMGVWVDPDSGTWYGLVHNEFTPQPFGDGMHFDSIDYATSSDQGNTWTIQAQVITSPFSTQRGDTAAFPNQTYYFGDGDPRLFVDYASGYFYVYYMSQVLNKSGGGRADFGHVARAPISGKMAPSSWQKWYAGSWSEPGIGGREASLIPSDGTSAGYINDVYNPANTGTVSQQRNAGRLPTATPLPYMNIAYNAYLDLYIGTPGNEVNAAGPLHVYGTKDLTTQKWTEIGTVSAPTGASWYRFFVDSVSKTSSMLLGRDFRIYCSFNCTSSSYGMYSNVTINAAASDLPVAPVNSTTTYQIKADNGSYLLQSGTGVVVTTTSSTSASQHWRFTPTGNGFFTITNSASGQALGVNDTTDTGRAWNAALTLGTAGSSPSVGKQWHIQRVMNNGTNTPSGSYRLVNRYSGLSISLTSNAVTSPQRNWNNPGATGDTRPTAAQTVTFTSTSTSTSSPISKADWSVVYSDSEETTGENGTDANAIDGNPATKWHTKWYGGSDALPHE
ncbi:RICIN domain-containing protein, partial [Streptomyces sp. HNM0663]